jgi:hypothetical protein
VPAVRQIGSTEAITSAIVSETATTLDSPEIALRAPAGAFSDEKGSAEDLATQCGFRLGGERTFIAIAIATDIRKGQRTSPHAGHPSDLDDGLLGVEVDPWDAFVDVADDFVGDGS